MDLDTAAVTANRVNVRPPWSIDSRQETAWVGYFSRQIFVNNVVESPFGQRLLFGANPHFEQLFYGGNPCGMRLDERVILQRVPGALDISGSQRVRRILKAKVNDILRRDAQETRPRNA